MRTFTVNLCSFLMHLQKNLLLTSNNECKVVCMTSALHILAPWICCTSNYSHIRKQALNTVCSLPKTVLTLNIRLWVQPCILSTMPCSAACVSHRVSQPLISPLSNARLNARTAPLPLLLPLGSMASLFRASALEVRIHAPSISTCSIVH